MALNGQLVELDDGRTRVVIASAGATLASVRHDDRDLVVPFDPRTQIGTAFQGRCLVPWPNRITDARYRFDDRTFDVPCNERESGAANHGLAAWLPWSTVDVAPTRARLSLDLPASPGYPFDITLSTTFDLTGDGVAIVVTGTNAGSTPAPFGIGYHPYLTCGGRPLDECTVTLPADRVLLVDERSAPRALVAVEGSGLDLRESRSLAELTIDNVFTDLGDSSWKLRLDHPDVGPVELISDSEWVQLYTGELLDRRGLAVEPMTCGVDAFNDADAATSLAPGESRSVRFRISAG